MRLDTIVTEDYPQPQVGLDYTGGSPEPVPGLDQFDRVVDQVWAGYGSNSSAGVLDEYKYGYNLQGDVAYRQNVTAGSADLDQAFTYDQQHDLTSLTQGQVNTATDLIMSGTQDFFQSWTPDGNGNWTTFSEGPSSNNLTLVQQRTLSATTRLAASAHRRQPVGSAGL